MAGHLDTGGPERLRVAIVGAGPAGTVCPMFVAAYGRRQGRDVEVVLLFDRKVFTEFGPKGCNLCAGVISHTVIRNLAALDVTIPPGVIQSRYNDAISRIPLLAAAHLRLALRGQRGRPERPRPFNDLLWYMFTGDSPYLATLRKGMSPGLWGRLPVEVLRGFFRGLGKGRTITDEGR